MDLNTATGIVAIRRSDYALSSLSGNKQDYFSSPDYWLYNASDVPKYRTVQIDVSEAQDGSEMVDSAAMKLGITNLLQVGDLPTLSGVIQPAKYWKTKADGTKPILRTPTERQAADDAIAASDAAAAQRRSAFEAMKPRRSHVSRVLNKVAALNPATATNAELVDVLQDLAPLLHGALLHLRTPVIEDGV